MENLSKNYETIISKLYASDFEVPQNRRRVIIIGIRKDLNIIPKEPSKIILDENDRIPVSTVLDHKDDVDPSLFLTSGLKQFIKNKKERSIKRGVKFEARFLKLDKPSYTIPARYYKDGFDALVKYDEENIRRLSIPELKRIQTFPNEFIFEGSKKNIISQIGNAVPCKFAYFLGKHIIKTINS